jgi:predicted glycoside hydrolase/deacetylase ChbG (UPF0249 family)
VSLPVVFGADDYGISPSVSAGIRALISQGRLSATSCMTVFSEWPELGALLRPLGEHADLGVHLTLTDMAPLGAAPRLAPGGRFRSFPSLARRAWAGQLDPSEVREELSRQLDAFEQVVGRPPDYLDGHHHVQQLPVVRDVVVELALVRMPRPYVRTCAERLGTAWSRGGARAVAFASVAAPLARMLAARGVATNPGFTGVYGFDRPYEACLDAFARDLRPGTFWMCHPGRVDALLASRDGLTTQREDELTALASDAFGAWMAARDIVPARVVTKANPD